MAQLKDTIINGNLIINNKSFFDWIYPIGCLYWSNDSTDPGTLFSGTKWKKIEDAFVFAQGSKAATNVIAGNEEITLSEAQLPSHTHSISHTHSYKPTGTVANHNHKMQHYHTGTTGGMSANSTGEIRVGMYKEDAHNDYSTGNFSYGSRGSICRSYYGGDNNRSYLNIKSNVSHTHSFETSWAKKSGGSETHYTDYTQPSFTGDDATIGNMDTSTSGSTGSGSNINIMPPYIVKYCWERIS